MGKLVLDGLMGEAYTNNLRKFSESLNNEYEIK